MKHTRRLGMAAGVILASAVLLFILLYLYERPGGWSDQRMSDSLGMEQTLQIPLGKSPEEAVSLFRDTDTKTVIHKEPAARGELVFLSRPDHSDLQVEYVRKTWIGWKWVWGGGFAISEEMPAAAMNYMSLPEVEQLSTPFPMVVGEVMDPSIQNIVIEQTEGGRDKYEAKLIREGSDRKLWFAFLPATAKAPFEIEGFDAAGERVASAIITDVRGSGSILPGK